MSIAELNNVETASAEGIAAANQLMDAFNSILEIAQSTHDTYLPKDSEFEEFIECWNLLLNRFDARFRGIARKPVPSHGHVAIALDVMRTETIKIVNWLDVTAPWLCRNIETDVGQFFFALSIARNASDRLA